MANVLDRILEQKQQDIAAARAKVSQTEIERRAANAPPPRDFLSTLRRHAPLALIAEVKKASPSAGVIRPDFHPVEIARCYVDHGAACLSVLTDEHFFQGHLDFLVQIRAAVDAPLLRKDFIIHPFQLWEARAAGADCVLLIAECLTDDRLTELHDLAGRIGLQTLIEVYDPENVDRVLKLGVPLLGVNNRDLRTFVTDLQHTIRIRQRVPPDVLVVGESGITTRADALQLQQAGVEAMLVGESLMRQPDVGAAVSELLGQAS